MRRGRVQGVAQGSDPVLNACAGLHRRICWLDGYQLAVKDIMRPSPANDVLNPWIQNVGWTGRPGRPSRAASFVRPCMTFPHDRHDCVWCRVRLTRALPRAPRVRLQLPGRQLPRRRQTSRQLRGQPRRAARRYEGGMLGQEHRQRYCSSQMFVAVTQATFVCSCGHVQGS